MAKTATKGLKGAFNECVWARPCPFQFSEKSNIPEHFLEKEVLDYLDGIIIMVSSFEEHLQILRNVFHLLRFARFNCQIKEV